MRRVAVFGATGSIGGSALDVIGRHPERFRASVLSANEQVDALLSLCERHRPELAIIANPQHYAALKHGLAQRGLATEAAAGPEALEAAARSGPCDTVLAAIVGAAGLRSTLAAAQAGKRLLLANKESIVVAGALLLDAVRGSGAELIPVDSEHSALFQCLPQPAVGHGFDARLRRLVLTASGGPFRGRKREELAQITPEQACAHPNWSMGRKISVDSASLMNKGLEVIEAHWLFGAPAERIEVVVHPQSIVHSLVEYLDGSLLAQLGPPDMRTAIACALAWPERVEAGVAALDLVKMGRLDFEAPDTEAFPCLRLAFEALRAGPAATTCLNAANEEAVSGFLQGRLGFLGIPELIDACLQRFGGERADDLPALLALDARVREHARSGLR
jgi:1-deoxy-D-xylulose-5-phosphate reductoisomerase